MSPDFPESGKRLSLARSAFNSQRRLLPDSGESGYWLAFQQKLPVLPEMGFSATRLGATRMYARFYGLSAARIGGKFAGPEAA